MDVYVNQAKKISIAERDAVYIRDLAEIIAPASVAKKIKDIRLITIDTPQKKMHYLVKNIDLVEVIGRAFPDYTVNNIGEMDTVVEYSKKKKRDSGFLQWLKIVFVILILLAGSTTAIMSFHTDAEIPKIFEKFHEIFFGYEKENPMIIVIPYSIGIMMGIVAFFNHFAGKKVTDDPTPIEVEMSVYDNEITDTVLDVLQTKRVREKGEGK